ncbi:hypothetical protein SISSUDRAFT_825033 [Sistotremastrum suecicum HHB10207 ss-3]|uniref:G domain-containing protein n=1 Tax=Sistotremastrum suecicum HHB10207 ss-3 TaxID=1314776 RepID=A0A166CRY2_9AGAM|nr:hypothetical protein SISSUDRAFT_825033 [Sistotremastrum suecicum HHB10207 ss-3]
MSKSSWSLSDESMDLRSYIEDLTQGCDTFRILVCGKAGVGKSSLVSEVFDFELENDEDARVSHFKPGEHDINQEITSSRNKSLILHDSRGLESGSTESLETIRAFLESRRGVPLSEQVHVIWYCVQIPVAGERPFEAGDQAFFQDLLGKNNVPLIVVFTKFDKLQFRQRQLARQRYIDAGMSKAEALERAKSASLKMAEDEFKRTCVNVLESDFVSKSWTSYCKVSIKDTDSVAELIKLNKSTLSGPDSQHLNMLWATAQKNDLDLKVKTSLKAGQNLYLAGLAATAIPLRGIRRVTTLTILRLIHKDVVKIWNFTDPDEILSGANFRNFLRQLFLEPLVSPDLNHPRSSQRHSDQRGLGPLTGMATNPAHAAGSAVQGAVQILDEVALSTPATARILMAYIADLTLGMESLFWLIKPRPSKVITRADVERAYKTYFSSQTMQYVHSEIRDYIGDEELWKAFQRNQAAEKVRKIVEKNRFNPTAIFQQQQLQHA